MIRRPPFIRRFFGDRHGVAAVEFAFIAPILILAYFGIAELCGAMLAERKAYHAASAIGDLVAQDAAPAPSDISDIFTVATTIMLPYASSSTTMGERVTSVGAATSGNSTTYTVQWSCANGALSPYAIGTSVNLPSNLISSGQSIIMADMKYTYTSPVQYVIQNAIPYSQTFYLRPRLVDPIPAPTATSPCN